MHPLQRDEEERAKHGGIGIASDLLLSRQSLLQAGEPEFGSGKGRGPIGWPRNHKTAAWKMRSITRQISLQCVGTVS
jgi:hypothetical protein